MGIIYVSGDVEATGPAPGIDLYSMVSFGMVVIDDRDMAFYREIKPISRRYVPEAMRVASKGLECLLPYKGTPEYDPSHPEFRPELVLDVLERDGMDPAQAMREAADWTRLVLERHPGTLRYCARPVVFDGAFMNHYFIKFLGENPFGYSGEDLNSLYRGSLGDPAASIGKLHAGTELPHHGLQDSILQGEDCKVVEGEMEKNATVRKLFR